MRLISKGTPEEIKVKCTGTGNGGGGCGATLAIEQKDIHRTCHEDYGGGTTYYATICCPECFILTDLSERRIPPRWTKWDDQESKSPKKIVNETKRALQAARQQSS